MEPRLERSTAEMWTNTSAPPSSGWMKPKPLVSLNHFTVPVAIVYFPFRDRCDRANRGNSSKFVEIEGRPGSSIRKSSVESDRTVAIFDWFQILELFTER